MSLSVHTTLPYSTSTAQHRTAQHSTNNPELPTARLDIASADITPPMPCYSAATVFLFSRVQMKIGCILYSGLQYLCSGCVLPSPSHVRECGDRGRRSRFIPPAPPLMDHCGISGPCPARICEYQCFTFACHMVTWAISIV